MYRFNYIFLLLLFTFFGVLFAQNKNNALDKLSFDALRNGFFDNEKNKNNQMAYAKAFLIKAKLENENIQIARAYYLFSLINKGNIAISYLDSVIKYSKNEKR